MMYVKLMSGQDLSDTDHSNSASMVMMRGLKMEWLRLNPKLFWSFANPVISKLIRWLATPM
jgi:hypothetical protein